MLNSRIILYTIIPIPETLLLIYVSRKNFFIKSNRPSCSHFYKVFLFLIKVIRETNGHFDSNKYTQRVGRMYSLIKSDIKASMHRWIFDMADEFVKDDCPINFDFIDLFYKMQTSISYNSDFEVVEPEP